MNKETLLAMMAGGGSSGGANSALHVTFSIDEPLSATSFSMSADKTLEDIQTALFDHRPIIGVVELTPGEFYFLQLTVAYISDDVITDVNFSVSGPFNGTMQMGIITYDETSITMFIQPLVDHALSYDSSTNTLTITET